MKRRIMMIVCAMVLVLGMTATSFAANGLVNGASVKGESDKTVTVNFTAAKDGVSSLKAKLGTYDDELELVSIAVGPKATSSIVNDQKNIITASWVPDLAAGDVLFSATFKVKKDNYYEATEAKVNFDVEYIYVDEQRIDAPTVNAGVVTIAKNADRPHEHAFGNEWKYDKNNHWHECACGEKSDIAAHEYGDDDICDVCGYEKVVGGGGDDDNDKEVTDKEPAPEKSADTDDNFNIALFGALALAAVAAGGCTVYARRRG